LQLRARLTPDAPGGVIMPVPLTPEQQQALAAEPNRPLRLEDPRTQQTYVLLRLEDYEQIKGLFEDEDFDIREAYPLMDEVAHREGWDDPDMDSYNEPSSPPQP
jgi:hypothetical protein